MERTHKMYTFNYEIPSNAYLKVIHSSIWKALFKFYGFEVEEVNLFV